ncbi:hypothetical protein GCM10022198_16930 [Klugiella xanthotipulae]|uniref:Uncharacterized protein n=2 Tax=Klugiella xanthotipulae TaxID=244735 RepID=A0A543HHD4_9MICO|nr:hypothetical protein FB466_2727 [Klugiella xanthotipulae]
MLAPTLSACTSDTTTEQRKEVSLPEGFPKDFKLAEGSVVRAEQMGDEGWSATVKVADKDAQDAAREALLDSGYTLNGSLEDNPDERTYTMDNGKRSVTLVLQKANGDYLVAYSFAPLAR